MTAASTKSRGSASDDQLPLPLSQKPPKTRRFTASPRSEEALARLHVWKADIVRDPAQGLIITGPAGSGVSLLTRSLASDIGGILVENGDLSALLPPPGGTGALLLNDCQMVKEPRDLVQLVEIARRERRPLVLAGHGDPASWAAAGPDGALIDLQTRLASLPQAVLEAPDTPLMATVLQQEMALKQITLDYELAAAAVAKLRRSLTSVVALANCLDDTMLVRKKAVDRAMIAELPLLLPEHML